MLTLDESNLDAAMQCIDDAVNECIPEETLKQEGVELIEGDSVNVLRDEQIEAINELKEKLELIESTEERKNIIDSALDALRSKRGFGSHLIYELADKVTHEYRDGVNTFTATKYKKQ